LAFDLSVPQLPYAHIRHFIPASRVCFHSEGNLPGTLRSYPSNRKPSFIPLAKTLQRHLSDPRPPLELYFATHRLVTATAGEPSSQLRRCLSDRIQDEDEMTRMRDLLDHRDLFENLEFVLRDRVTSEQRLV